MARQRRNDLLTPISDRTPPSRPPHGRFALRGWAIIGLGLVSNRGEQWLHTIEPGNTS